MRLTTRHASAWPLALVLTFTLAASGCDSKSTPSDSSGAASASGASAGSASTQAGSGATPSASAGAGASSAVEVAQPPATPARNAWVPKLWERAYDKTEGDEPPRPIVEEAIPQLLPGCANFQGREYLREKFKDDYARETVATQKLNAERRAAADIPWLPQQQAWFKASQTLHATLVRGVVPKAVQGAMRVDKYGPPGTVAKATSAPSTDGPEVDAFRTAFASTPGALEPFRCWVTGAQRAMRAIDPKVREALRAKGQAAPAASFVDQFACVEITDPPASPPGYTKVVVVIEVPGHAARAKLQLAGEQATIEGYELEESFGLDPVLKAAMDKGDVASVRGAILEVQGVRKLHRAASGPRAYAMLKDRGMENKLAVATAEYKVVWVASFERGCPDLGTSCVENETTPSIKVVGNQPHPEAAPPPVVESDDAPREPIAACGPEAWDASKLGRWEASAWEADPKLNDSCSYHDTPWGQGFLPTAAPNEPPSPTLDAFRAALAKRGGLEPFACDVLDMGEQLGPTGSPLNPKADGSGRWDLVCRGDAKSHQGTVVVSVAGPQAFAPELRDQLLDVGRGTKFLVSGSGPMKRSMLKYVVLRSSWSTPVWRLDLTDAAPAATPVVTLAPDGLKPCEVKNRVYPPPK